MFRSAISDLRTWWEAATADILGGDLPPTPDVDAPIEVVEDFATHRAHPHREPLRPRLTRRGGSVAPRPAYCLSPVRHGDADPAEHQASLAR